MKPESINLLGQPIKINHANTGEEGTLGSFDSEEHSITICESLTGEKFYRVLLHEVLHAALHYTGHSELLEDRQEEALVVALEYALAPIYRLK